MIKFLHIFLAALLAYIAYLQFNDPDPLFWVSLYALAALVPLQSFLNIGKSNRSILIGITAGYCLAGTTLSVSGAIEYLEHIANESIIQDMSPFKPYIEETREFMGTLFAFLVVFAYWLTSVRGWRPFK